MKNLWITLIACFLFSCSTPAYSKDIPPVDRTQPVYQMKWGVMPPGDMWIGGSWEERELVPVELTPKQRAQIEAENTAAMYRKAAYFSWVIAGLACIASYLMKAREGIGVAIICGLFSFASSFMAQSVHYGLRIGVCAGLLVMIGLCYHPRVRDWSLSHSSLYKKLFGGRDA